MALLHSRPAGWLRRFGLLGLLFLAIAPQSTHAAGVGGWATISDGFLPSTDASSAVDSAAAVMFHFGGSTASGKSDVVSLLQLTDHPFWVISPMTNPWPAARYGHAAASDPVRRRFIVFGGDAPGVGHVNERWLYQPGFGWTGPVIDGTGPGPRIRHAMMLDPLRDRVLLYGGRYTSDLDDLWELKLSTLTWTRITPPGVRPPAAVGATLVYDSRRDRALLYGGRNGNGYYDQIWELVLSGATPRWRFMGITGQVPLGRWLHGAAYDPTIDAMVVHGGEHPFYGPLDEVWAFSRADSVWWSLTLDGAGPGRRAAHTFVRDPISGRFITVNGREGGIVGPPVRSDTWALSLDDYTAVTLSLAALEVENGRVRIVWYVPDAARAGARVTRFADGGPERALGAPRVEGADRLVIEDPTAEPGRRYRYRIDLTVDGRSASHEATVEIPLRSLFDLAAATPNPSTRIGAVRVTLPDASPATLEVIDVRGRRLGARAVGVLGAGAHVVPLPAPAALGSGIYFVRLVRAGDQRTLRWAFAP